MDKIKLSQFKINRDPIANNFLLNRRQQQIKQLRMKTLVVLSQVDDLVEFYSVTACHHARA